MTMGYLRKHQLFALVPLLISAYFFGASMKMPRDAALLPQILAVLVACFSVAMIFNATKDAPAREKEAAENPPAKINVQHVVVFVAAIAVYIYLIPILGYFIATPLYMVVMYAYLKAIGLLKSIIISVCFSAFIYALFVWFLKLPIPVGVLEHFMGY